MESGRHRIAFWLHARGKTSIWQAEKKGWELLVILSVSVGYPLLSDLSRTLVP